jgi:hypothetical protein
MRKMKRRGVRHKHCDARVKTKKMKRRNKGKGEKGEVMREVHVPFNK